MKIVVATTAVAAAALAFTVGTATGGRAPASPPPPTVAHWNSGATPAFTSSGPGARGVSKAALNEVVRRYCVSCHNPAQKKGNLVLDGFDIDQSTENLTVTEKVIRKLRAQMMPPPGSRTASKDTMLALVETMEEVIDKSSKPNPGNRTFQRLNRPEYERAVRDLLGVTVNAGDYLPLDTKSANFDNIADAQALSPTLLESYLNAAAAVSRMAVGDRKAPSTMVNYVASPFASQHPWDHVDGAPFGTRGGIVAEHNFVADADYTLRLNVSGGVGTKLEDLDVSIDGVRVALIHYEKGIDRNGASADSPVGADYFRTEPIHVKAGAHRVTAAFVRKYEGPYEDLIKPHEWSRASNGNASAGITEPPHVIELAVFGPDKITGVSETPSRKTIFSCRPSAPAAQRACAQQIVGRVGERAYRRPLTARDKAALMQFYDQGAKKDGFEEGVRTALQAMLASPWFVFRFEPAPAKAVAGEDYRVSDLDLASRLSFFIWGSIPDQRLLDLAEQKQLSNKKVLETEVRRMLADPKAEAMSTRFAAQWLRLQDLEKVHPDAYLFPDFDLQMANAMQKETELFFNDIVRNDRSVLDVFTADYTFVNERLARHYGIPDVAGPEFRKVTYPDASRRGLLGQGSILVQTSIANRTSPVLRGKWVMEVLLGTPPPPPPPGVPDLEETKDNADGKPLTTRERMEIHRKDPVCRACHQYMDPMGLSLDNFDVTGKWRTRENAVPLDTKGTLYDGTPVSSPQTLTEALLKRPIPLVRAFTENLMAYALGRRVEDFDQPTVRIIGREAEAKGYKFSSFVMGVVNSSAFRSKRAEAATTQDER